MLGTAPILIGLALFAGPDTGRDLAGQVLAELEAKVVPCPEKLVPADACGQFDGDFSKLKFELDFEFAMRDFSAEPLTPWQLRKGVYLRTWRIEGEPVTIGFERVLRLVAVKIGPLADREAVEAAEKAERGETDKDPADEAPKKDDQEQPSDDGDAGKADDRGGPR